MTVMSREVMKIYRSDRAAGLEKLMLWIWLSATAWVDFGWGCRRILILSNGVALAARTTDSETRTNRHTCHTTLLRRSTRQTLEKRYGALSLRGISTSYSLRFGAIGGTGSAYAHLRLPVYVRDPELALITYLH
jgi:hypothetical protein